MQQLSMQQSGVARGGARRVAAAPDPSRAVELTRTKRPPPRRFLRKSDLEDKLLITRTTGRQFGTVGEAWVEPRRLYVQSFDVTRKTQVLRSEVCGSVPWQNIKEVGDVVLIHADQDFRGDYVSDERNLATVSGMRLMLDDGSPVGICVDFVFDPENGRIVQLVFHTVNLPFAKKAWFDQYGVNVQNISRIVLSERVIYLKNDASWKKAGAGEYQFLANLIPSFTSQKQERKEQRWLPEPTDSVYTADLQEQYQQLLQESRRQQEAYYARYGRPSERAPAEPQQRPTRRPTPSQMPPRSRPASSGNRDVRFNDWLEKEETREELFMQE